MTAVIDWDIVSDAELAAAAATGNQAAFAGIYDRYADRLHDFCVGMVRDREAAADCVQDTFVTAATRLSSLRELDKLRPWLYAIARNEALRRIRERNREQPSDELPEVTSAEPGPEVMASRTELATLIAQVAGGLSDRDRAVLELTYRHGLDGPELAEALGVSAAGARTMTHRLRETIERSLGALLVARRARTGQGCAELGEFLSDWDGEFTILMRKRIARHIDTCPGCLEQRGKMVNPVALLGGAPLFIPAPAALRKQTLDRIQLVCAQTDMTGSASSGPSGPGGTTGGASGLATVLAARIPGRSDDPVALVDEPGTEGGDDADDAKKRRRRMLLLFLWLGAAGIAALVVALLWPFTRDSSLDPVVITQSPTQPSPTLSSPPQTTPPRPTPPPSAPPSTSAQLRPTVIPYVPPPSQIYIAPTESAPPSRPPASTRPATPPTRTSSASPSYAPQRSGGPAATTGSGGNGPKRGSSGSSDSGSSTGSGGTTGGSTGGTTGGSTGSTGSPRSGGNSISSSVP